MGLNMGVFVSSLYDWLYVQLWVIRTGQGSTALCISFVFLTSFGLTLAGSYQIGWNFPCVGLQNIDRMSIQKLEFPFAQDLMMPMLSALFDSKRGF